MFQRFTVVMEYQQKPVLPPPFIAFCHCYNGIKYLIRKAKGLQQIRDNGLKLFLEKEDMERLYDFEEECVEGFFHEMSLEVQQSTDERIKNTDERVENMTQKIEDINQKENSQLASVQNIEFRMRKVEESTEQILSHLAVIHRFMSTHTPVTGSVGQLPPPDTRIRTISEPSDVFHARRKFNRSLTEVRTDAYIFEQDGLHQTSLFDVVPVPEETEALGEVVEALVYPTRASLQNLSLNQEGRDRKFSMQSEDSDFFMPSQRTQMSDADSATTTTKKQQPQNIKPPTLSVRQETQTSSESKDTLTPLDGAYDVPVSGEQASDDPNSEGVRQRGPGRRRNSSMCVRRNSETGEANEIDKSQLSLNTPHVGMQNKRQVSITQSEPDSGNEGGNF